MENDNQTPEVELDENQINEEVIETEEQEVEETDWKQEALKQKAEALKYKAILERNKNKKPEVKPTKKSEELSQSDVIAIIKNNVNEEDIPEVADYARLKGITVSEALKTPIVKTILKDKEEQRNVAEATHTGATRKGASKVSDETLIANARAGKMPENEADMMRLIEARKRFK